jgi:hypothetical protein
VVLHIPTSLVHRRPPTSIDYHYFPPFVVVSYRVTAATTAAAIRDTTPVTTAERSCPQLSEEQLVFRVASLCRPELQLPQRL